MRPTGAKKANHPSPFEDEKSIQHTIDEINCKQAARPAYKPKPDHPWRKMTKTTVAQPAQP